MAGLTSQELRNGFRELHLQRLSTEEQNHIMLRITDDEIKLLSLHWQKGDNEAAEKLFSEIYARPDINQEKFRDEFKTVLRSIAGANETEIQHLMTRITARDMQLLTDFTLTEKWQAATDLLNKIAARPVLH